MIDRISLTQKQERLIILAVILLGVQIFLIVRFSGWFGVAAEHRAAEKNELAALKQELNEARATVRQEAAIWNSLSQSAAALDMLAPYVPAPADRYAWAYEYISHRASLAQITLNTLEEVLPDAETESVQERRSFDIRLSTRCGYNNLVEFLWRLEQDNPLLRIKTVNVSTVPGLSQDPRVQVIVQWLTSLDAQRVDP